MEGENICRDRKKTSKRRILIGDEGEQSRKVMEYLTRRKGRYRGEKGDRREREGAVGAAVRRRKRGRRRTTR